MTQIDSQAIWIPNNNYFPNRNGYSPRYIVLHATAGGTMAQNIANYFASTQGTDNPVSSHYVIGQDGTIVQCVSESDGAWCNGAFSTGHDEFWNTDINPNNITVSIEHCKPSSNNADAITPAQQASSFALIKRICQRHNIPMRLADATGGITGHFSIDPVNRSQCPGVYPWAALWSYLQPPAAPQQNTTGDDLKMLQLTDPMGKLFSDSTNSCWVCNANKIRIGGDHLVFFRKHEGIFGLPLTAEIRLAQYPNSTFVIYERVIACFDPRHEVDHQPGAGDVFLIHLDGGVGRDIIAKPLVSALNAQIKQLTENNDNLNKQLQALKNTPPPPELAQLQQQLAAQKATIETYKQAINVVINNLQHLA